MANDGDAGAKDQKLHIDDDWKAQARAEKERLASEGGAAAAAGPDAESAQAGADEGELPPASFEMLVQTLASQAMLFLSPEPDPRTGRSMLNLDLAKHTIDLLSVLEKKTQGNLTDTEKRLIDTVLYQLRMAYVQVAG